MEIEPLGEPGMPDSSPERARSYHRPLARSTGACSYPFFGGVRWSSTIAAVSSCLAGGMRFEEACSGGWGGVLPRLNIRSYRQDTT